MSTATEATVKDASVLYDIMIESSTRLVGSLYATMTDSASESDAVVIEGVNSVLDRADAVDEGDVAAIVAATEEFRAEREQLEA